MYAVDIAVDTDWELFSLLGSVEAVTDYAAMLIGAASAVYQRDLSVHLHISDLFLWTTPADPWTVTSGLFEALFELGDYWHANHPDIERTLVHWMSGNRASPAASPTVACSAHRTSSLRATGLAATA